MSEDLKEIAITLLGSATVDLKDGDSKSIAYTVPDSRVAMITHVIIHSPDASLADGVDFDIGSGVNADTWRQTISLTTLTASTDYIVIPSIAATPVKYTQEVAGAEFGIKPITGATLDAEATMEVYGIERDA